ncbi:MAG: ParA family protein [Pseudomonadota bacterium]
MLVIAIATLKGGSGKTTLAAALAVLFEKDGRRVVIVDLDPQATASEWFEKRGATPNGQSLVVIDCAASRLQNHLSEMHGQGFDIALLDCPPGNGDASIQAASLADFVLLPTRGDSFDLASMRRTLELIDRAGSPHAIILNGYPLPYQDEETVRDTLATMGGNVCPSGLPFLKGFSKAHGSGQCVSETDAKSKATKLLTEVYKWTSSQVEPLTPTMRFRDVSASESGDFRPEGAEAISVVGDGAAPVVSQHEDLAAPDIEEEATPEPEHPASSPAPVAQSDKRGWFSFRRRRERSAAKPVDINERLILKHFGEEELIRHRERMKRRITADQ